ncbi:hypothetical protein B0H14DRAFT_2657462 [Mycena olivaceomarginata]|nr:hypothetical protein B0H14DRAFT_2657462 [Mycena olivaceomarginata]
MSGRAERKKLLGDNHPNTLITMGNLSMTYQQLGNLQRAEEHQTIVLREQKFLLGDDHPDTLSIMGNLATTYTLMDKINEAEALEILVLEKQTNILAKIIQVPFKLG